jgi:SET domain-containing protein
MQQRNFRVGRSKTGLGVFATCSIKKGTYIVDYFGKKIASLDAERLRTRYLFELNDRWTIDGSARANTARYINHSCKPNSEPVVVRDKVRIRAIRNIAPGDEITYDYGRDYFRAFIERIPCKCDACESRNTRQRAASRR